MSEPQRTPLNARHKAAGARMVDFGGWEMPVQYTSILAEHAAVREAAGLFDVSHMGVFELSGPDALAAGQYLVPNDLARLQPGQGLYTQLCNPSGGVLDDLLIFALTPTCFWLVVNAGNRESDFHWVSSQLGGFEARLCRKPDPLGILALQGPRTLDILTPLAPLNLDTFKPFSIQQSTLAGHTVWISRSGYTGEDGVEIYAPHAALEPIWDLLLSSGQPAGLVPVGLGARDTLRLEAAMPLYGHELDDQTSPLEAGLGWSVKLSKSDDFIGKAALQAMQAAPLPKKRVGFSMPGSKRAPRQGYTLYSGEQPIGQVTSGSLSPTLGYPIGMAYLDGPWTADRPLPDSFEVDIRGQRYPAQLVKLPFYRRNR
ncbi:MAG: glycine cleavage system aminomethyltransferase GcvT [Candidatus Sericytochromatia bacterium]|nr:glycine cleavage system aminomethyltransferase GcvT [Candidatus Sericytochromatia bacterium]